MPRKIFCCCFALFFSASQGLMAGSVPVLGQVVATGVVMDGVAVPSGTTVLDKTVLKTSENPAVVHLSGGQLVALHRNSSAYLEKNQVGAVRIAVRSGTLSFRADGGAVATAIPETTVIFPTDGLPTASPQAMGVQVVLTRPAQSGQNTIAVNDAPRIDPRQAILIRSRDGRAQAIHFVRASGNPELRLTAPLERSFAADSPVTQDLNEVNQALAAGVGVVGASAGGTPVGGTAPASGMIRNFTGAEIAGIIIVISTSTAVAGMALTNSGIFAEDEAPRLASP